MLVAGLLIASAASQGAAQDASDMANRIINDPSNPTVTGASARLLNDSKVQGGKALRVTVPRKGEHPWSASIGGPINKPVKAGDNLVLAYWVRLEKGEAGPTTTLPYGGIQLSSAPYTSVVNDSAEIGPDWKLVQVKGKADKDYPAGALNVTIHVATARQTIDFGPVIALDMGPQ
jgi:hypothetical protein